jgi:hypothetical protein
VEEVTSTGVFFTSLFSALLSAFFSSIFWVASVVSVLVTFFGLPVPLFTVTVVVVVSLVTLGLTWANAPH